VDIMSLMHLTGAAKNAEQVSTAALQQAMARIRQSQPDLPAGVEAIIQAAMHSLTSRQQPLLWDVLDELIPIYQRYFTHDDIRGLLAFYATPLGEKAAAVLPQIVMHSRVAEQAWAHRVQDALLTEVRQRLPAGTPLDLVQAGRAIFYGHGTCSFCHEINSEPGRRGPTLAGIGQRAATRITDPHYRGKATTGAEYLAESLYDPALYVVEGYEPTMPPQHPPFTELEIVALVAFMQSLGGTVTVDEHTRFTHYRPERSESTSTGQNAMRQRGAELVQAWACTTCHTFDGPGIVLGPSLWDIGVRATATMLREALLAPAATVEGYPRGVMHAVLEGNGFYQKVTLQELNTLVDYLLSLKGPN
jgi:cytochrome c2